MQLLQYVRNMLMSEELLQRTIIQLIRTLYPDLVINLSLNGVSLEGLSADQRARLINQAKAQGMTPGIPDLLIYLPEGKVLNLELKTAKGKQSKEQIDMQNKLEALGHTYYIIRGIYEPFKLIIEHTSLEYRKRTYNALLSALPSQSITEPFLYYTAGTEVQTIMQDLSKLYYLD